MSGRNTGYDAIVIGGGIAGLVAANRAAELGRRVAVLEKGTAEKYLCNTRYTYGTFHINFSLKGVGQTHGLNSTGSPEPGQRATRNRWCLLAV